MMEKQYRNEYKRRKEKALKQAKQFLFNIDHGVLYHSQYDMPKIIECFYKQARYYGLTKVYRQLGIIKGGK